MPLSSYQSICRGWLWAGCHLCVPRWVTFFECHFLVWSEKCFEYNSLLKSLDSWSLCNFSFIMNVVFTYLSTWLLFTANWYSQCHLVKLLIVVLTLRVYGLVHPTPDISIPFVGLCPSILSSCSYVLFILCSPDKEWNWFPLFAYMS